MNEVLSQDEIDQLLTAISSGDSDTDDFKPVSDTRKIKIYDFKRPDKFSKEQLRIFVSEAWIFAAQRLRRAHAARFRCCTGSAICRISDFLRAAP